MKLTEYDVQEFRIADDELVSGLKHRFNVLHEMRKIILSQRGDEALWVYPSTPVASHLQAALRHLHSVIIDDE